MKGQRNNLDLVDPSLFGSQGKLESKTSQPLLLLRPTSCSCGSLRPIRSASTPLQRGWRSAPVLPTLGESPLCVAQPIRCTTTEPLGNRYPKPVYEEYVEVGAGERYQQ